MKKYLLLSSLSICAIAIGSAAYSQSSVTITKPDREITVEGEINTEPQLIPIQIITDPATGLTTAKLTQLQQSGATLGLNKLMMEGRVTTKDLGNGRSEVNIVWDTASMIDEDSGEKKTTPFGIPFTSKVLVQPQLGQGDQFNAEGDPLELIAAWERLTSQANEEEEEEEEEEDTTPDDNGDPTGGGGAADEGRETEFESPDFTSDPTAEPNVVTEACDVRVDIEQMAAIAQERVLVDGVEETPCSDTLTRYPITQKFNECPLIFDVENLQAFQQFTLVYNDPVGGETQAQGCTQDTDNPIALIESTESCGIRHDFTQNLSYQQSSITYEYQGAIQTLQDCQDGSVTYSHVRTQDGCTPVVSGSEVTFQERVIIDVDGVITEILACQPNPDTTTTVSEEECTGGNRYTHDFTGNQTFLNKTFYYDDNGTRVDIATCIASDVTFSHMQETSVCSPSHDDVGKTTTMFAQTFIEETAGNRTYISNCEAVSPSIPYVQLGERWRINSSNVSTIIPSGSDANSWSNEFPINHTGSSGSRLFNSYSLDSSYFVTKNTVSSAGNRFAALPSRTLNDGPAQGNANYFSGARWCIQGELTNNWEISGSITLNQTYSTDTPTVSISYSPVPSGYINRSGNIREYSKQAHDSQVVYNFSCSSPTCLHTHLVANPYWQRGDLSEYVETSVTAANMHVCGDGSNLDGTDR